MIGKKVMIYAYTAHNLGDDLFIQILCQRYPHVSFYLYAPKIYRTTFQHVHNLHIIPNDTWMEKLLYRFLPRPQLAVYIGGSLFIEQAGWKKDWRKMQGAQKRHRDFFILGANFGPYHTEYFYDTYSKFFNSCTDICFRDKKSFTLYEHLPNIRYANDVVFTQAVDPVNKTVPTIVISVIYPAIRRDLADVNEDYFRTLASFAMKSIDNGYDIIWMAFCKQEKDDQAINEIYHLIHPQYYSQMMTCHYETDISLALHLIAQARAVIATRFHAMILALLYEKPTFAIVYSNKMTTVIEDNQLQINYCHIKECYGEKLIQEMLNTCGQKPISIDRQIIDAEKQFSRLDKELKEG